MKKLLLTGFQRNLLIALCSLGIVTVTMVFQNCGEDGFKARYYSEMISNNPEYPSPFEEKKVVFDRSYKKDAPYSTFQVNGKTVKSTSIEAGEPVVVFVDNNCASEKCESHPDSFSCRAWSQGKPIDKLEEQAYDLLLNEPMTEYEISERVSENVAAEECLVGITNYAILHPIGTIATNDPQADQQPYLDAIGLWDSWEYFNESRSRYSSLRVAIIDSGVNRDHEDMGETIHRIDYTGSGSSDDCSGHGTFVSGIINARPDNNLGIVGMAQGHMYNTLKVFECSGGATISEVVNAMNWAGSTTCNTSYPGVVNLSLGGTSGETALRQAIASMLAKNCLVVVAAGNDGQDLETYDYFPANLADDYMGVIAVAATNDDFELTSFSNYSNKLVEIAAPGEDILSLSHLGSAYTRGSGTSYAAPMVTAAAALAAEKLSRGGLPVTGALLEQIIVDGSTTDTGLENYVIDGKRLDLVALEAYLKNLLENMNTTQIGVGDPVPQGAGFQIPVTFSRGVNDYVIEMVERTGGSPVVTDSYTIQSTYGSLDFVIITYRPEKVYEIVLKDQNGVIISVYPLPSSYFFKPDITNAPILGKVHQVFPANVGYSSSQPEWIMEGWACIEQFPEALEIEVWKNGMDVDSGGSLVDTIEANQRARGEFYEECKDSDGNVHPSINVGFWYQPRYYHTSSSSPTRYYFKAIHPRNPDLSRFLDPVGEIEIPGYSRYSSNYHSIDNVTRNNTEIRVQGYACSYQRNEHLSVSLMAKTADVRNALLDVTYDSAAGDDQILPLAKGFRFGNRRGCSRSLPYPEFGAVCGYLDIDGQGRSFQDLISDIDRTNYRFKTVVANQDYGSEPRSNCYKGNMIGFDIRITDFSSLFNVSYILGNLPPGASDVQTPSTQEQALEILQNVPLYLEIRDSRARVRAMEVSVP